MTTFKDPAFPIFLTVKEASHIIGCCTQTLETMVREQRGPPHYRLKNKTGHNRRYRFKKTELLNWLEQNRA